MVKLIFMLAFCVIILALYPTTPPVSGSLCTKDDIDFKEYRYKEQIPICNRNVTTQRKIEICNRDGVINRDEFTVDHFWSLNAGGSNRDDNLWCQHKSLNVTHEEYQIYLKLRDGEWTQEQAINKLIDLKVYKNEFN